MTLAEFLLARIAEDEAQCRQEIEDGYGGWQHESGWPSYRVLAECEAKRRIVESARHTLFDDPLRRTEFWRGARDVADADLRFLALPYSDHPDYDEAWRP